MPGLKLNHVTQPDPTYRSYTEFASIDMFKIGNSASGKEW